MRSPRHHLTRDELSALLAASAQFHQKQPISWRQKAARLLRRLADRIAGQNIS